jgi:pimeloyl-ACP methyl ester carboxylesterase
MERLRVDEADLEYQIHGSGQPILLIHGCHISEAFLPLIGQPPLARGYQLIRYHRRGFGKSTRPQEPVSIPRQAADAARLLQEAGIRGPVHVVGYSYGGAIALQLAVDAPELVHSLALLEPALPMVRSGRALFGQQVGPALRLYLQGDKAGAVATFLSVVSGPDWQSIVERYIPGGVEQAVNDADTYFQVELPALRAWNFGPEQAITITRPCLSVVGTRSHRSFQDGRELLASWLPHVEDFDLDGATHFLQIQDPEGAAKGLAQFFERYPIPRISGTCSPTTT